MGLYKICEHKGRARDRLTAGRAGRSACPSRDLLGHASIVTTERYDNQRLEMLQAAVARLEDGKDFDAGTDATDKVSRIFQDPAKASLAEGSEASKEILRSN